MTPQVATIEELIEYLTDMPAGDASRVDGLVESVGRPKVPSPPPACPMDGFQAHEYASRPDAPYAPAPQTEAALIH